MNKLFAYQDPFPLKKDDTEYYLLNSDYVSIAESAGQEVLETDPQVLILLAQYALHDASLMLYPAYQQQVVNIPNDPKASENDKYVALQFLRNSDIAVKDIPPTCQGIDTVIIMGKKGQRMWIGGGDEAALAQGVYNTYIQDNLRYSQNAPLSMYKEVNTGTNLPVQIDLYATDGDEYRFPCIVEGDGSANKTYLYQETKALITPAKLKNYLVEKMRTLGTVAYPLYHIAFVIGGISAEATLKTVKLASTKYYDSLPTGGNEYGQTSRDVQPEQELLPEAQNLGLGAQFGGKYFAHDARVIRPPRHGASYPAGMGVPCPADCGVKVKINRDGVWTEKPESNLRKYIPGCPRQVGEGEAVKVSLSQLMSEVLALLSQYPVSTCLSPSGTIIVARDIAHVKLKEFIDNGEALPQYVKDHLVYYAGLAETPDGYASSSLGPTTAGRMGSYVDLLQSHGASKTMLAKDNRNQQVIDACHKHGGFYPGSISGPAAVLAQRSIRSLECVAYPGLGMEAIWKVDVEDFPVFIPVNSKDNDFFQQIQTSQCARCVK